MLYWILNLLLCCFVEVFLDDCERRSTDEDGRNLLKRKKGFWLVRVKRFGNDGRPFKEGLMRSSYRLVSRRTDRTLRVRSTVIVTVERGDERQCEKREKKDETG